MASIPSAFDAVCLDWMARDANRSSTLPTPARSTRAAASASSSVSAGGSIEKSRRFPVRANATRRAGERAGDDARNIVRRDEHFTGGRTPTVQLLERNHVLVRRDLKTESADVYTIQSPVRMCSAPNESMIVVPLATTLPMTRRPVRREFRHDVRRKSVRVRRKRLREMHAGDLPMAGGAVLSGRRGIRRHHQGRERRRTLGDAIEGRDVAESARFEVRQIEAADRRSDVAERVASGIAVRVGVGGFAGPNSVEDDYRRALHIILRCSGDSNGREARSGFRKATSRRAGRAGPR